MTVRGRFVAYVAALHVLFAVTAAALLWHSTAWLVLVEALFVLSVVLGAALARQFFATFDTIRDGIDLLRHGDFAVRFRAPGQPEADALVGVYNEMMERLQQERVRLQEQQYFLEKVVDASPSGVLTLDFDGRVATVNPAAARLLEADADRLRGRTLGEIEGPLAPALLALGVGESTLAGWGGRRVRGRRSEFLDRGFPRSFFLIEEMTHELRRSEREVYEKLIRMLSHEVNNSVGATSSLLHSCLSYGAQLEAADRQDFEGALRVVIARTEHLGAFMRSFAEVVRLPEPRRAPGDLAQMARDVALVLRAEAERRRVAWRFELPPDLPPVDVDRGQMEQVFLNVFKNALEAIGEEGAITVRARDDRGRTCLEIEDTGSGMTAAARGQVFTPFFTTKRDGQGLGLTVVQEILSQHGCEYALDGPPGGPTRFTIRF